MADTTPDPTTHAAARRALRRRIRETEAEARDLDVQIGAAIDAGEPTKTLETLLGRLRRARALATDLHAALDALQGAGTGTYPR